MLGRYPGKKYSQSYGKGTTKLEPKVINVPADYPTLDEANRDAGRIYTIGGTPSVTDNDPTKTNTDETYDQGQEIMWNGIDGYFPLGSDAIFVRSPSGYIFPVTATDTFGADGQRIEKVYTKNSESTNYPTKGGVAIYDLTPGFGTTVLYGGEITINGSDPTKFDLAEGAAIFVNNYTDPADPVITLITWVTQTGITVDNIATTVVTFVNMTASGLIQRPTTIGNDREQIRDEVPLALLTHPNLTTISDVGSLVQWERDIIKTLADFTYALGSQITIDGNEFTANGSNLFLNRSAGISFLIGGNYILNKKNPNMQDRPFAPVVAFALIYRPINIILTTTVPNTQYDPNGDGTLVDLTNGYFVAHRVYYDPLSNTVALQYGQFEYDSLKKAAMSWSQENFIKTPVLTGVPLRTVLIIQKGCTDLTDADSAKFAQLGVLGDKNITRIDGFSQFAENIEIIDGMSYQQPSITFVNDGGTLYADVEAVGGGNITYAFSQREFILDCTTGSGVGGKARVALTAGTAISPVINYIYVTRSGNVAILSSSTTFPTGQFGWVCEVLLPDAATFDSIGVYSSQRYSDNKSHNGRGALSYEREKIRSLGVTYLSGIVPTITITQAVPDLLDFAITAGEVYQLHKESVQALNSTSDGIFIINHPTTPWLHTTSLADIQIDSSGASLDNRSFNFVFIAIKSSSNGVEYSHLGILLPTASYLYTATGQALSDENNTAITSVPNSIKKTAFLIARVTFRYKTGDWENLTADLTSQTFFDLRGLSLGATSGGAGTPSLTEFDDNIFRIFNNADNTKKIAMDASKVTTGTTPKIIMADHDVDLDDVSPQWQDAVISFVDFTTSEPALVAGNRYINTGTGLSSITSQSVTANYIYEGNVGATSWDETIATAGMRVWVNADVDSYLYTGAGWFIDHSSLAQQQYIVAAKAGNDSNSGKNDNNPDLSLIQAVADAVSSGASISNPFRVKLKDGGIYDIGATNLTIPAGVHVDGSGATIKAATGSIVMSDNSSLTFNKPEKTDGGFFINKTAGSGSAVVNILSNFDIAGGGFINLANGSLQVNFNRAFTSGTLSPTMVQVIGGNLFLNGTYLKNDAAVGYTLRAQGSGRIHANVKNILATDRWLNIADTAHAYIQADITSGTKVLGASTTYDIREGATRTRSDGINVTVASGDITETIPSPGKKKIVGSLLATGEAKGKGDITGMVVTYGNTITVFVTAGSIEMNGKLYILSSNTNHVMSTVSSAFGIHYIYIDDSASTPPAPTFIDSTSAPAWSDSKRGWYGQGTEPASPSTNDRCIGAVISRNGLSQIDYFSVAPQSDHIIRIHYGRASLLQLASNMNPISAWQTPNLNESSVTLPVMSTAVKLWLFNQDAGTGVVLAAASSEMAVVNTALADGELYYTAYGELILSNGWVNLGSSRNVKIGGANDDEEFLSAWVTGYEIKR